MSVSSQPRRANVTFAHAVPLLMMALWMGAGGGFVLATILTSAMLFHIPLGLWWEGLVRAHGHVQVVGWAGLLIIGVGWHFMPRLRGAPLPLPQLIPWIVASWGSGLVLRILCQPWTLATGARLWATGWVLSASLEAVAIALTLAIFLRMARSGPPLSSRTQFMSILPWLGIAVVGLTVSGLLGLSEAINAWFAPNRLGADTSVNVALFAFVVPVALAMMVQTLPIVGGLEAFPRRYLMPLAGGYGLGVICLLIGLANFGSFATGVLGIGMLALGMTLITFAGLFLARMARRKEIPQHLQKLSPTPVLMVKTYQRHLVAQNATYGPYVTLVVWANAWLGIAGGIALIDGVTLLLGGDRLLPVDALRHSLGMGFIAALIFGVAPRMLPSFAGVPLRSPRLVQATLWLGMGAAVLRVAGVLITIFPIDPIWTTVALGIAGPLGLAAAWCLLINLWPVLLARPPRPRMPGVADTLAGHMENQL